MSRSEHAASPYKGLASYTEDDAEWFFGRDGQVRIAATNLMSARITIFYGESGVGKTSLLRAGVVPRLRVEAVRDVSTTGREDFRVALHNRWQGDAIPALVQTIRAAALPEGSDVSQEFGMQLHLDEVLSQVTAAADSDLLLILDQFEEWFLYHGSGESPADSELLRAMGRVDLPVHYLVSLRQDALAQLDRFKGRIPGLFDNLVRLRHLDRRGAHLAVERPLEHYNAGHPGERVEIEPALVERVLDGVRMGAVVVGEQGEGTVRGNGRDAAGERIEAPFLQLVMTRLWDEERTSGSRRLRLETLDALGGAERIIRTHLDQTMDAIAPDRQTLAAEVFKHLVTPSGAKIAHSVGDLAEYTDAPREEIQHLLDDLAQRRILRPIRVPPDSSTVLGHDADVTRYEIFHDVLAAPILDWRRRREGAERAMRLEREREGAQQEADRERKRARAFRAIALALVALLLLVVATTAIALDQRSTAQRERRASQRAATTALRQARLARYETLRVGAASEFPIDPSVGMVLAVEADKLIGASDTSRVVAGALSHLESRAPTVGDALPQALFSPDGRWAVAVSSHGIASLYDARTGRRIRTFPGSASVSAVAFSPNGMMVATADLGGPTTIWDASSGRLLGKISSRRVVLSVGFSQDNRRLLTAGQSGAFVWDVDNGRITPTNDGSGSEPTFRAFFGSTSNLFVTLSTSAAGGPAVWGTTGSEGGFNGPSSLNTPYAGSVSLDGKLLVTIHSSGDLAAVWRLGFVNVPKRFGDVVGLVPGTRALPSATWIATLRGQKAPITAAAFSGNNKDVITASLDGTARIWNPYTGAQIAVLDAHHGPLLGAELDRNARIAVTSGADGTLRVWRVSTGREIRSVQVTSSGLVISAEISPDDSTILTDTSNGLAQVWNLHTGRLEFTLGAHSGGSK